MWDQQLREWLDWRLAEATAERRLRGETALFPNPTARNTGRRWCMSSLEREWKRACVRAGVEPIPLQQGTRHSVLTALGQALPERVLRDFQPAPRLALAGPLLEAAGNSGRDRPRLPGRRWSLSGPWRRFGRFGRAE